MKKIITSLLFMLSTSIITGQTNNNLTKKDTLIINSRIGVMGMWQAGNLNQFNIRPNGGISLSNNLYHAEINASYNYLKVGNLNPVNDLWIDGVYQFKPNERIYPMAFTNHGFAKSYKINYSSLSGAGLGINIIKKKPSLYLQANIVVGYLHFEFENELAHTSFAVGSVIKSRIPLSKQALLKWELSSYHSSKEMEYWGAGNLVQLDLKVSTNLFVTIRHQLYYNHKGISNTKKYNSIVLFGIQYQLNSKH